MTLFFAAIAALPASLLAPAPATSPAPSSTVTVSSESDLRTYWRSVAIALRRSHGVDRTIPLFPDGDTPVDGYCTHLHPTMDLLEWFSGDDLVSLIFDTVRPQSWDEDGSHMDVMSAFVMVTNQRDVQLEVEAKLTELAEFIDSLDRPPVYEARSSELRWADALDRLHQEMVTFGPPDEGGTPLVEIANELSKVSHLDVRIPGALFEEFEVADTLVRLPAGETSVHDALVSVRKQLTWLHWSVSGESLVLHRGAFAALDDQGPMSLEFYDVRPLMALPKVPLLDPDPDAVNEVTPDVPLLFDPSRFEEYLRNTVATDSWEANPASSVRITEKGLMAVCQTQQVHRKLRMDLTKLQQLVATVGSVPVD